MVWIHYTAIPAAVLYVNALKHFHNNMYPLLVEGRTICTCVVHPHRKLDIIAYMYFTII